MEMVLLLLLLKAIEAAGRRDVSFATGKKQNGVLCPRVVPAGVFAVHACPMNMTVYMTTVTEGRPHSDPRTTPHHYSHTHQPLSASPPADIGSDNWRPGRGVCRWVWAHHCGVGKPNHHPKPPATPAQHRLDGWCAKGKVCRGVWVQHHSKTASHIIPTNRKHHHQQLR